MSAALLLLTGFALYGPADVEKNPLTQELINKGLPVLGYGLVKLPAPTMANGLDKDKQVEIIKKAADRYKYNDFIRKAVVAPHVLKITAIEGPDMDRKGQKVDLWFVAYGTFDDATKNNALDRLLGNDLTVGKAAFLTPEELSERKIAVERGPGVEEKYSVMNFAMLDKIQISGIGRAVKTTEGNSLISAVQLDPRFTKDVKYPNQWQSITKPEGVKKLGPPHTYSGFGGYVKVTELKEPAGALFVEFHLVISEPRDWFDGANLLKAKLPLAIQDRVRTFRKQLQ